jgi:hypothetical protein
MNHVQATLNRVNQRLNESFEKTPLSKRWTHRLQQRWSSTRASSIDSKPYNVFWMKIEKIAPLEVSSSC